MPNLTGDPNRPVNVTIRALEPTDNAIPDLWNVPFQQLLNNDANLNQRVSSLETSQGGTTLAAHRSASVLDHPDGSVTTTKLANGAVTLQKLAAAAFSTDPTPNTLVLRNAQGAVQSGITEGGQTVLGVNGHYRWIGPNGWLRLAQWTGFTGSFKAIIADLHIVRTEPISLGSRLRVLLERGSGGSFINAAISLSNDHSATVINAALIQTDTDTIELWVKFAWGKVFVWGIVGTGVGSIVLTPYGDVSSLVQDEPPSPVPNGLYLEWATATVAQTFVGPGNIVAASRGTTSGFVRYDNGLQIVWGVVNVGSGSWTFPAAFASTPQVQATAQDSAPRLVTITSVSPTAVGINRTDLSGATQSGVVHLHAIGLWK
jgi:hypothetical protein